MSERRVVVTGMGAVTCLGVTLDGQWKSVLAGESGVSTLEGLPLEKHDVRFGGQVKNFPVEQWIDKKEVRRIDRYAQFAVACAEMAMKDSGLDMAKEDAGRCGVVIGSGIGGLTEFEEQHGRLLEKGPDKVSPFLIPKLMINAASGLTSIRFGLRGPNYTVASACASATHAMGDVLRLIQRGEIDLALTGGAEATMTPTALAGFANMKALSTRNDDPKRASRPFDKDRDGFVMGEGAGVLVFEELEHAKKRGARIYGEVLGFGMTSDAFHITAPDSEGTGAAACMRKALADAKINPERVQYVNAHGTSTPLNDKIETLATKRAFGDHARKLAISSTKSMIGHLLGASGAVGIIFTLLSVRDDVVHPTINYTTPDPDCDLDYVPNQARQIKVDVAISNAFGFGGHNATLVVGKLK